MANVELQLLSRVVRTGCLPEVREWGITEKDFRTTDGRGFFINILGYWRAEATKGAVPGPFVIKEHYQTFEFCDDPAMTTAALCHEVRKSRLVAETKEHIANRLEDIDIDPIGAITKLRADLAVLGALAPATTATLPSLSVWGKAATIELSETQVTYAWEPAASPGWFVMIAGPVAGGKTTLAFQLAVARANTGLPVKVLGREVQPAPAGTSVVLLEGEVDEIATAKKLRRSCAILGVSEDALERIIWTARKGVKVGDAAWLEIEVMIAAGEVSDVFLDTLARVAPGESNSEESQAAIFDSIAKAVESAPSPDKKPIVWALAHTRKGGGASLEDVLGSVQRTAQIDSALILEANRDAVGKVISVKTTFAKLRHDPEEHPAPVVVTISKGGLEIDGVTRDLRPLEERVLDLLVDGAMTKTAIGKRLGKPGGDVGRAVENLFAMNKIVGADVQTSRGTYRGIALRARPMPILEPQSATPERDPAVDPREGRPTNP